MKNLGKSFEFKIRKGGPALIAMVPSKIHKQDSCQFADLAEFRVTALALPSDI